MKKIFLSLTVLLYGSLLAAQISFKESARALNVEHHMIEWTVGGGVSFFDFNQDGLDDLSLATTAKRRISFYVNTGNGFALIPPLVDNMETVKQILWVDFDNDGDYDLYVAAFDGINRLYQNSGDLVFQEITEKAGLPLVKHRGYGACFGDYNRDGWLDLHYNSRSIPGTPNFKNTNRLFKNNADGTFTETTEAMNAADANNIPFSSAFLDYNNDNWPDLYTANDRFNGNTLLENKAGVTFEDVSATTNSGLKMNAMCVTTADVNQDGWTDIYLTNTADGNKYLLNTGNTEEHIYFKESASEAGIEFFNTSWGANFLDADNDGDLDLYVSGAEEAIGRSATSIFFESIDNEQFEIPTINGFIKDTAYSYSNAVGDYNNDGYLDIIVQNNPPFQFYFWENTTQNSNQWIKVQLEGVLSNRDAIGAKIECFTGALYQSFYTQCGFSFLGQNSTRQHIGLREHTVVDSLIITWPTGHKDHYYNLSTKEIFSLKEGQSTEGKIEIDNDITIKESQIISTSIKDEISTRPPIITPNPVKDQLVLQANSPFKNLRILDVHGRHVAQAQFLPTNFYALNVANYQDGMYFIQITYANQTATLLKWVKN